MICGQEALPPGGSAGGEATAASPEKTLPAISLDESATPADDAPSTPLTYAERMKLSILKNAGKEPAPPALAAQEVLPIAQDPPPPPAVSETSSGFENGAPVVPVQRPIPPSAPNRSVFVRYLPTSVDEDTLVEQFNRYGPLQPSHQYPKVCLHATACKL